MRFRLLVACAGLMLGAACSPANTPDPRSPEAQTIAGPVHPTAVDSSSFAASVQQLLLDGSPTEQRTNLLAGVTQHQLGRAAERFPVDTAAGDAALTGAFFLMRAGEYHQAMIGERTRALLFAADEAARTGNLGRSFALYRMLDQTLAQGSTREDVVEHLKAMQEWTRATRSAGPMQAAAMDQDAALQRAVLEPTPEALAMARDRTVEWMQGALDSNIGERPIRDSFERDEAVAAYRAVRAGGAMITALYLRHGDPHGALAALEDADLLRVIPPGLRDRLERAADDDDPEAWSDLYQLFDSADDAEQPTAALDPNVSLGAAWGAAVGLYRAEPTSLRGAMPISTLLVRLGMAEAAPVLLADTIDENTPVDALSWALSLVMQAIVLEERIGQLDAARRTFDHAKPLLDLARSTRFARQVRPSPARLDFVMGALETRSGQLERARPHVARSVQAEPTIASLKSLAAIDRQQKQYEQAIASLKAAAALAKRQNDPIAEADALVTMVEVRRDAGQAQAATELLEQALNRTLEAREAARSSPEQARTERLLARVLEFYGNREAIRRATERAYEAARSNLREFAATVIDASRRALTNRDLSGARDAVLKAIEAQLPAEDIVYVALWLRLLERELKIPSDGTVEEAFATIEDTSGWPATLRAWGRGRLKDDELLGAAQDTVQRTEAKFYAAMATRAAGNEAQALSHLQEVAQSRAIDLVEVTIARDLVAQQRGGLSAKLPGDVTLP